MTDQGYLASFLRDNAPEVLAAIVESAEETYDPYVMGRGWDDNRQTYGENPIDPDDADRYAEHTDTCNGDHSDVSGRCESDPVE